MVEKICKKIRLTKYYDLKQIFTSQSCPQMSKVTACQVLITFKHDKQKDDMIGIKNKREFENLLSEIVAAGEDPMYLFVIKLEKSIYPEITDIQLR